MRLMSLCFRRTPDASGDLGLAPRLALNIDTSCSSAISSLIAGSALVQAGYARSAAVVCSSRGSQVRSEIPESTPFVDAAGACVLGPTESEAGIIDFEMVTRGEFYGLKTVSIAPSDGTASSEGMVYRTTEDSKLHEAYKSERLEGPPRLILRLLRRNHLAVQDVDLFLFHQSRLRDEWTKRLRLDETRVPAVEHGGRRANLGAASLLYLLDREFGRNNGHRANRILMCEIGLGMNYGVLLYER